MMLTVIGVHYNHLLILLNICTRTEPMFNIHNTETVDAKVKEKQLINVLTVFCFDAELKCI
jgi:hypothetical protein